MTWSFICWEMMTPEFGTWQPLLSAGTHLFSYCIVYLTYLVYIGLCCRRAHFELVLSSFFFLMSLVIVIQPFSCLWASLRLVSRLFYDCDQGQVDPVVAIARDQSSVYLQLLMHETQPPSQFTVSTITRYVHT